MQGVLGGPRGLRERAGGDLDFAEIMSTGSLRLFVVQIFMNPKYDAILCRLESLHYEQNLHYRVGQGSRVGFSWG
jgi:hypothetical protein